MAQQNHCLRVRHGSQFGASEGSSSTAPGLLLSFPLLRRWRCPLPLVPPLLLSKLTCDAFIDACAWENPREGGVTAVGLRGDDKVAASMPNWYLIPFTTHLQAGPAGSAIRKCSSRAFSFHTWNGVVMHCRQLYLAVCSDGVQAAERPQSLSDGFLSKE